ncbi:hypothetical protein PVK06_035664 [Gossypium arboreum]|uniref:Uncharacterized protein n=1 Tax=Gossypium arboreum TaxID=29729 RepID=A0ABR0NHE9_GOSAR|nr:hypothetical protein PVK06_035664 [Gossypium arboreum]
MLDLRHTRAFSRAGSVDAGSTFFKWIVLILIRVILEVEIIVLGLSRKRLLVDQDIDAKTLTSEEFQDCPDRLEAVDQGYVEMSNGKSRVIVS